MKSKFRIVGAVLLAAIMLPAMALQLGEIEVKSSLNQPLVASIPLAPKNLAELDGLTVGLAPEADYTRAGLSITPGIRSLRFQVITDTNGQKRVLVTSIQAITDPYLDFLIEVNTHAGKQVREIVVLLNPLVEAPAPQVQTFPAAQPGQVAATATAPTHAATASAASRAAAPRRAGAPIEVVRGDTLYQLARKAVRGTDISINQMMLALKAANAKAFYRDNINNLRAGAILRIPTRDVIRSMSAAAASAEVSRQYAEWREAKARHATVVAGHAAEVATRATPSAGAAAAAALDHLSLTPPAGKGNASGNRPGVTGGTGSEMVAGLQQQLQTDRDSLISVNQANADLDTRVRSLKDIADKSERLLSLKDANLAELQRKLAALQASNAVAKSPAASPTPAPVSTPLASAKPVATAAPRASVVPQPVSASAPTLIAKALAWIQQPMAMIGGGVVVVVLLVMALLLQRRSRGGKAAVALGPLDGPHAFEPLGEADAASNLSPEEDALYRRIADNPGDLGAHRDLCRWYYSQGESERFVEAAEAMYQEVLDPFGAEWLEVKGMGEEVAPQRSLFARRVGGFGAPPVAAVAQPEPVVADDLDIDFNDTLTRGHDYAAAPAASFDSSPQFVASSDYEQTPALSDDPVDTKLDLARAYLDMGDPVGARAMLEEVIAEGSPKQKTEAKRLLAEAPG